ncbi:GNAT family N-acetyltransferase [Actinotignum timonense]|uniref:GNAT family N-acetyltransferase n=1 Tax=Actinotignum timonense TaxID=1870995 RepID=UPI000C7610F0|nr:DUF4081 domain-containing GNAT family N-acetyltransferase [Actinotignum timonense]WOS99305.1 GNAT family N-acetyltransferase [Actinotignum timonense]
MKRSIWPHRAASSLRRFTGADKSRALEFLARDPINSVLARVNVERMGVGTSSALAAMHRRDIEALAWDGGNIIPLGFSAAGLRELGDDILSRHRVACSILGPADQVLGLWEHLERSWSPAREVRARQYSLSLTHASPVVPDPQVRPAEPWEFGAVFPAAVAMFTEEVGYDPTVYGPTYARRVRELIRAGRTFVRMGIDPATGARRVEFKADIGALAGGVAQIQGVWTAPDLRGRGIATRAMASVVDQVRARHAPTVSLYVNDYNAAAVRLYQHVGFSRAGEWATVLL